MKKKVKQYVGFGLGAIQTGLFLREARTSNNFAHLAVVEVVPEVVEQARRGGGNLSIHIAHADEIVTEIISGVEILHPADHRARVLELLAEADEVGTAIPSVDYYRGGEGSIQELLATGLSREKPVLIHTAENNNHAAEILHAAVAERRPADQMEGLHFLNSVIGKMSGVVDAADSRLAPLYPGCAKAHLVEAFNRILISRNSAGIESGFTGFQEKPDLLPFEEAKLYGHNCMHAWLAYRGMEAGLDSMDQVGCDKELMAEARQTFLSESGGGLLHRHGALGEPLFTPEGFGAYVNDLLERMVNPFLSDLLTRVGRDPRRKLAPDDRLVGAAKLAMSAGIEPTGLLRGIRAGARYLARTEEAFRGLDEKQVLKRLWGQSSGQRPEKKILDTL